LQKRTANDQFWWKSDKADTHAQIFSHVKSLKDDQDYRSKQNLRFIRLYGNSAIQDLSVFGYARTDSVEGKKNRLTLNIVQSMCDTVSAKIAKNNPKPMFITSGGDWSIKRKAKKLNKFCEGQFHQTKIYEKGRRVFLDATIFGTGVLKIYRRGAEIICERVFPEEIIIDDMEGIHGEPRQLHQVKWINRQTLIAQYPEAAGYIDQISSLDGTYSSYRVDTDMLQVTESWHLRSGPNAKDGKHVISIENKTLLEEDYSKDYFPFVFLRWTQGPLGFFGQGLAEQLQGIQLEINKILKVIQEAMHLGVIPKIFVQEGSDVVTVQLNNKIGTVVKYRGAMPTPGQLLTIPKELFQQLDWLYNRAYEVSGVSQLSAQAKKPSGLDSGKALREFNDIESERFILVGQAWEQFYLEASRQMIDLAREISEDKDHKDYEVKIKGKRFFESIKWSDIDLEEDQYIMQVFPTSGLASTPAGRFQQIQEFLEAGFITPERAKKLMDMPDLESDTDLDVAALDDIEATMERMIDGGEYEPPEPYQNLTLGSAMMKNSYLKCKNDGVPEEVLEMLRNWVVDAETMLKPLQPPVDPAAGAPAMPGQPDMNAGAAPIAVPNAPPTSDLLPVA
jgi:hypothetical protein